MKRWWLAIAACGSMAVSGCAISDGVGEVRRLNAQLEEFKVQAKRIADELEALNRHLAEVRKAFEKKEYAKAAQEFRRAQELAPSPQNAFNLGTAEIAAGQREQGSATLAGHVRELSADIRAINNAFCSRSKSISEIYGLLAIIDAVCT